MIYAYMHDVAQQNQMEFVDLDNYVGYIKLGLLWDLDTIFLHDYGRYDFT